MYLQGFMKLLGLNFFRDKQFVYLLKLYKKLLFYAFKRVDKT